LTTSRRRPSAEATSWGDVDCSRVVDATDALHILRFVAGLPRLSFAGSCPEILAAGPGGVVFGDMDCSGRVDAVDALLILRFVSGLKALHQPPGCPLVGG
jgi:hypothetical protein